MRPALISWDAKASILPCRWVKGAARRSPRRCLVTAKKKDASEKVKKLQKLCDGVEEQLSVLKSELVKIKASQEQSKALDKTEEQNSVAREILDRQEAFFKEERAHWMTERAEWQKQETTLLQEIARLQEIVATSPANDLTAAPTISSPLPSNSMENKTAVASSSTTVGTKTAKATEQGTSLKGGQDAQGTGSVRDVGASIAAAMSAVDKADVLSDNFQEYLEAAINGATIQSKAEDNAQIETIKSPPTGPPPSLTKGDDDIFWVHQLQEALVLKGYYCGEDDAEDYYFGDGTLSALSTFQACTGLKETGMADISTWKALLGENIAPITENPTDIQESSSDKSTSPLTEQNGEGLKTKEVSTEALAEAAVEAFPVLSEMDGGRDVHCLQVMLETVGFSCGKDDMQWWHYGDDTINALKTFQACNGLPQSGVSDEKTWVALAGIGKTMADVHIRVKQEDIYEEDLSQTGRVWLLGEQRWERKL